MKKQIFLFLLLVSSGYVSAQSLFTLDSCRNMAMRNNKQLQMAKAKVQEITPVYTVVQPATVPLRASKPSKLMILVGFVFLAGVGSVGWILFVKDFISSWKRKEEQPAV